jgi:hypothetical protein
MSLSGLSGYLDIPNANLRVAGAVQTGTINVGSARIFATYDLDVVTAKGNTTPYTIGFSNATTGLATTSNAQIGGNLTVSSNLTVGGSVSSNLELASNLILNEDLFLVGNTQIRNNSNVVTEFTGPHGRPQATLTKFPEIQMTEKAKAGYVVSASSSLSNNSPHYAFDNDIGATSGEVYSWQSGAVNYDTSGGGWLGGTGAAYSTTVGGTTYYGEWIQLKLPLSIDLSHVDIYPQTHASVDLTGRTPQTGKLVGSTNGTTWVLLKDFTLTQPPETGYARIDVATANYYTYFRLVAETTFGGVYGNYTGFAEMKLFGTPEVETAGDISQDTTLKSIYNTPSNLDANVYLDGDLGATLTNQISGGPALTGTGATYDSAGKYWSLDGSTESNVVTGDLAFQGDQPHSVSLWFNSSNLEANVANSTIYHIGTEAATGDATHRVYLGNKNLVWNYGKDTDLPLKANTWHHLTHTYEGVGGYRTLYLDGRKVESAYAGDTAGEFPPFDMTGYSQGGYAVSASGENTAQGTAPGRVAYKAFNSLIDDNTGLFQTLVNYASDGSATASAALFEGVRGDWLKLELPTKIKLGHVSVVSSLSTNERIETARIFGSNDDVNWEVIKDTHTLTYVGTVSSYSVNSTKYFKYLLFQILSNFSGPQSQLYKLQYYGHKENDLIRFPDATNVRKYPDTAMTSNGPQRGYTVTSGGSVYNDLEIFQSWNAFDGTIANNDNCWISDNSPVTYSTSSPFDATAENSLSGITGGVGSRNGAWLKLELPHKIKLNEARLYGRYNANTERIDAGYIYGSNDDTNWTQIGEISVSGISSGNLGTYTEIDPLIITSTDTTNYYKYFIIQPTSLTHANGYAGIGQMEYYGTQESTPVLARLGGAFEGKVANFRVYNKCIKEDQALELWDAQKDQFGLAKSSVTVYKGRVGIGTTEPQAALTVADEVAIPKSGEFPPGPMTNYETHFKDHGLFRASSSDEANSAFKSWMAFNDNQVVDNTLSWGGGLYTLNSYIDVNTNAPTINGVYGAWLQLDLPYKITLDYIIIQPRVAQVWEPEAGPGAGNIWGSNDGVNWNLLASFTGFTYGGTTHTGLPETAQVNSTTPYSYFRLQPTKRSGTYSTHSYVSIGNLSFFGTPETTTKYSTLHDGELTLTKSLNVPRIGPAPDSWFYQVPQRDKLVVELDTSTHLHIGADGGGSMDATDTSGNDNHGYYSGDFSTTNESWRTGGNVNGRMAFYFDGNNDELTVPNIGNPQGAWPHSVSVWVSPSQFNNRAIFFLGTDNTNDATSSLRFESSTTVRWFFHSNDIVYNIPTLTAGLGNWTHFVCVYDGGVGTTSRRVWMNGQELTTYSGIDSTVYTNTLNIPADTAFRIARRGNALDDYDGFISSIRLYDGILSTGDVQKLYEMGRNGPMQTMNIIGTAVGINQNNPQASLDVAGKIKGNGGVTNFTGQHRCVPEGPMEPGLIVSADKNRYVNMKDGLKTGSKAITIDESLPVVALSNVSQDKSCFGVVSSVEGVGTSRSETKGGFISETPKVLGDNRAIVNSLGEGALWVVNTGGPLESGDYVTTSNVAGYGQRQDDDVLHNYTVAKITMDCDFTASNVATQAPKKVETLVTVGEGVWSNLSAYNRSSETQTQYINGENVVLTEGEWSNLATEEQNTYSDTTITTYYEIRRGENLLDENGNIQWEDTDGVEPGYKVRFLTSDGTQTDEANAVHIAAFVGCTYHCG